MSFTQSTKNKMTKVNFPKPDEMDIACPACGSRRSRVNDSRAHEGGRYRQRKCVSCKSLFSTKECAVETPYYSIFKKDKN
jgi:transcriptional regulator NrdR family protein